MSETPEKSTRWDGKSYTLFREDDPDIRALVPRPAAIVAEHRDRPRSRPARAARSSAGPDSVRKVSVERMLGRRPSAPLDVAPARRSSGGGARSCRTDSTSVRWTPPRRAAAQLDAVRVLAPVRHIGHEIDAEQCRPARAPARPTSSVASRSRSREQRLQDAVRREHHAEAAARETAGSGCRRGPDADAPSRPACASAERAAGAQRSSIGADRSMPTR